MNKLRVALFVSMFAFMAASALADDIDMKPMSGMSTEEAIAARKAARDHWSRMTPQERWQTVKAARGKKRDELTALDQYAKQQMALRAEHERASGSAGMH
jgi:hypothetical protein